MKQNDKKFFSENIFAENIYAKNISTKNISTKNIFFGGEKGTLLSTPYTTPTSSYLLFEVEGGDKCNELTDRTHTRIVSLIVLDYHGKIYIRNIL